jgi:phenylalanyl-tRNA synthetase beta chain
MKFSLNQIKYYQQLYKWSADPAPNGVDHLLQKIGAQLGGVEEVSEIGKKYDGALIVKVVSCEQHPNADRLHVCLIDDGGKAENVPRDEQGLVQVVCGAPNVKAGVTVVWLPPGVAVPSSYNDDPFVLEARELRGVVSNGMLASPKELAIGDSHEGLLLIDEDVEPGTLFADKYLLNGDVIVDIENKMFTHRPDCFGWMGVAREIAGIEHASFTSPDWYTTDARVADPEAEELKLEVRNEAPELVPRFTAVTMSNITIGPSPVWLQVALSEVGLRPINSIVDLTNYYMLLTGQPLHAYDYDKVMAQDDGADHATIVVRKPQEGEKLTLLNGKEIEPRNEAILIASRDKAIGLGGVMGGENTEVDENTKNIILECANFNMYSIRKTSMHHGIFSDAVTRFNKGQSPLQNMAVLAKIVADIRQIVGGKVASEVVDDNHLPEEVLRRESLSPDVKVTADFINARLGSQLTADEIAKLLTNVEFKVAVDNEELTVRAPFWRTDIEIPEDVVEEVGRLYGYDNLPLTLPTRPITPTHKDPLLTMKAEVRNVLSSAGADEVLTYSFVHGNLLDKAGQNKEQAFKLSNALSPDLQYYRLSLTPSILDKIHPNIKAGYDEFALYELGKAHMKGQNDPVESDLPKEGNSLGFVYANKKAQPGAPYYTAVKYLQNLLESFGASSYVALEPLAGANLGNPWTEQIVAPYEPGRSAILRDSGGLIWGVIGEFRTGVRRAFKLPDHSAGFEIDTLLLLQSGGQSKGYVALPRYPRVTQDITLRISSDLAYQKLHDLLRQSLETLRDQNMIMSLSPLDIYQREDDPAHKQITFRLSIASYDKTMTDQEVAKIMDDLAAVANEQLQAERV